MNNNLIDIIEIKNAKIIISSQGQIEKSPLDCSICNILIRDRSDINSYKKYECCFLCELEIVHPNKTKWLSGWRLSQRELDKLRKKRKLEPSYLMVKRG
tara:strand:- start:579 stop:875 length:297 start_codon:yes stop_codon:yes gene_type:complete